MRPTLYVLLIIFHTMFKQPQTGIIGDKFDERDYLANGDDIPLGGIAGGSPSPLVEIRNNGKRVNLHNTPVMGQGRGTVTCTPYAGTHQMVVMQTLLKKDKRFYLDPKQQVINQKEYPGTWMEGVGDYVNSPLKALKEKPLEWWNPDLKQFESFGLKSYKVVDVSLWKQYLKMGYPLLTGGRFSKNPVDKNGYLNFGSYFGHCLCLIGFDDIQQRFSFMDSSKITKDGIVHVDYQEATEMFRGWSGIPK